ncbi:hypothetical protein [Shewanella sp. NFH-SH190041]|uniref:hypothetical protein n=1 Tax=Shewanella sp. NFH-SH190041 TaxID=2950245 RepID=UPI0021C30268|nr:hypothetical protein [Shewanella sp. NFH-SH190041]
MLHTLTLAVNKIIRGDISRAHDLLNTNSVDAFAAMLAAAILRIIQYWLIDTHNITGLTLFI